MGRKPKDSPQPRVHWSHRTILIVDDVPANFEILKNALASTGAKIAHAQSGMEGIRKCLENRKIDLVIMDINLPGLNGLEATRELKTLKENIVIIGQSAFISACTRNDCLEAGMDEFFIKPINPPELIGLIRATLIKRGKRV
ncbi:MAG: response regulator [Sphingobacteriia bacterium]|nr:response regulator [Sphingobacteriia bacterium]